MMNHSKGRWFGIDSWAGHQLYSLAPLYIEEGMMLTGVFEGGMNKATVAPTTVAATVVHGMAFNYNITPTQLVNVETQTVPATGTPAVTLMYTPLNAATNGVLAKDANNVVYTYNATTPGTTAYTVNGNVLTFGAGAAGAVITFQYAYAPTVAQAQYLYGQGFQSGNLNTASAVTGTIGVIRRGLVYTTNFNPGVDYSTNPNLYVGANGTIDPTATTGVNITARALIYELPSSDSAFLGLNIDFI